MPAQNTPSETLSTTEICRLTRKNRMTLARYEKAGLLPPATPARGEGGRGQRHVYPAWVVERVRWIEDLTAKGFSYAHIADMAASARARSNQEAEYVASRIAEKWRESGSGIAVARKLPASASLAADASLVDYFGNGVQRMLRDLAIEPAVRVHFVEFAKRDHAVEHAIKLIVFGVSPVMLFAGVAYPVQVIPDVALSHITGLYDGEGVFTDDVTAGREDPEYMTRAGLVALHVAPLLRWIWAAAQDLKYGEPMPSWDGEAKTDSRPVLGPPPPIMLAPSDVVWNVSPDGQVTQYLSQIETDADPASPHLIIRLRDESAQVVDRKWRYSWVARRVTRDPLRRALRLKSGGPDVMKYNPAIDPVPPPSLVAPAKVQKRSSRQAKAPRMVAPRRSAAPKQSKKR